MALHAPEGIYSYYHPDRLFTGLGWDAQSASVLFCRRMPTSILILGLGGGTVARQCRTLAPKAVITGVEISARVVALAKEDFNLAQLGIETLEEAGQDFLRRTRRRFDVILDDMWPFTPYGPKPVLTEPNWASLVHSRLSPDGLYAVNLYSRRENRHESKNVIANLCPVFRSLRQASPASGDTTVIIAGTNVLEPRQFRRRIRGLAGGLATAMAHIQIRTI